MNNYVDVKKFFKKPVVLSLSIVTFINIIITFVVSLWSGTSLLKNFIFVPLQIQNTFTEIIQYIFSVDIISVLFAVAFFLFFFNSRKNKSLKMPAKIYMVISEIEFILTMITTVAVMIFLIVLPGVDSDMYFVMALFFVFFIGYYLAQFVFSCSIRKVIETGKICKSGAKITSILNYFFALGMFAPIISINYSAINIILILTTTLTFLLKGIVAGKFNKYMKTYFHREVLKESTHLL